KFYLGSDRTEAQVRYLRLDQVWAATEKRWVRGGESGRPLWDETTLRVAQAASRGESEGRLELPRGAIVDGRDASNPSTGDTDTDKGTYPSGIGRPYTCQPDGATTSTFTRSRW